MFSRLRSLYRSNQGVTDVTMGNSASQERNPRLRGLLGQSNALGLSKAELDARCKPSGLYPSCHWEEKAIRRLIGDGKLAARLKGNEVRTSQVEQECPICFLHYTQVNVTKCCQAVLCTECYLQVKPQREKTSCCPFCNTHKLQIEVAQQLNEHDIRERQKEEQRALEAQIKSRSNPVGDEAPESVANTATDEAMARQLSQSDSQLQTTPTRSGFGSSLEQNERVALMRARSESMTSDHSSSATEEIAALAMTPQERRALEAEMRAQQSHPLARRLQAEAAERRLTNEREYYRNLVRSHSTRLRSRRGVELIQQLHEQQEQRQPQQQRTSVLQHDESSTSARSGRDWNRIVDAFESGGNGNIRSLDDLVVLEAAIMLSMQEEEERRRGRGGGDASAISSEGDSQAPFDAARHASRGFPLARARVASRRQPLDNEHRRPSSLAMETAALVMRGMSEEEQLAMAIAASLEAEGRAGQDDGDVGDATSSRETGEATSGDDRTSSAGAMTSSTVSSLLESATTATSGADSLDGVASAVAGESEVERTPTEGPPPQQASAGDESSTLEQASVDPDRATET